MEKLASLLEELAEKYQFEQEDWDSIQECFAELENGLSDEFQYEQEIPSDEEE